MNESVIKNSNVENTEKDLITNPTLNPEKDQAPQLSLEESKQMEKSFVNTQKELSFELAKLLAVLGDRKNNNLTNLVPEEALGVLQKSKLVFENEVIDLNELSKSLDALSATISKSPPNSGSSVKENTQSMEFVINQLNKTVNNVGNFRDLIIGQVEKKPEYKPIINKLSSFRDQLQAKKLRVTMMRQALG